MRRLRGKWRSQFKNKSYHLDSVNPFRSKPAPPTLYSTNKDVNSLLAGVEKDLKMRKSQKEVEEFVDFEDKSPNLNNFSQEISSGKNTIEKINHKRKKPDNSGYKNKRMKKTDNLSSERIIEIPKRKKKMNISSKTGWIIESKKKTRGKKNNKKYDTFDVFDKTESVNDNSIEITDVKEKPAKKEEKKKKETKPKKRNKKAKKTKSKLKEKKEEKEERSIIELNTEESKDIDGKFSLNTLYFPQTCPKIQ